MLVPVLLFIVGFILLIKGGDWFVDGASGIAHRFRIPEIIIGATVVSIGTTLPEVMVSATGAVTGHGEMAYGNAIGSIICNTALIAALTVAIKPGKTDRKSLVTPVIFFFAAALFFVLVAYIGGEFSRWVGIILLAVFVAYIIITVMSAKKQMSLMKAVASEQPEEDRQNTSLIGLVSWIILLAIGGTLVTVFSDEIIGLVIVGVAIVYGALEILNERDGHKASLVKELIFLVIGAAVIAFGADLLVDNGTIIAEGLGVPESVIALTFVALGTSLPELVTAITALAKGHGALSLGNVIGANLFNIVLVCGVSATLAPFGVPSGSTLFGINSTLLIDLPIMLGVMAILTLPPIIKGKLSRWQGITLLCIYAAFCVFQFII